MRTLGALVCMYLSAAASGQLIPGLEPCLIEVADRRIITVAVHSEGQANETAKLYAQNGEVYPHRTAEHGFGAPFPTALESAVSLAAMGGTDYRWPLEPFCEFTYKIDSTYTVTHPVHVYVYKIDPMGDLNMPASWFDDIPMEKNGLAVLGGELGSVEDEYRITWHRRGRISY